jgi:hypothetical protein
MKLPLKNQQEMCRGKYAILEGELDDLGAFCHSSKDDRGEMQQQEVSAFLILCAPHSNPFVLLTVG